MAVVKVVGVVGAGAVKGVVRAAARAEVMVVGWAAAARVAATAAGMAAGMAAAVRVVATGAVKAVGMVAAARAAADRKSVV